MRSEPVDDFLSLSQCFISRNPHLKKFVRLSGGGLGSTSSRIKGYLHIHGGLEKGKMRQQISVEYKVLRALS